jgi:hypothetical protein
MALEIGVVAREAELDAALDLGCQALAHAEASGTIVLAGAAVEAEALVLGALQRTTTLRERSPARFDVALARRATTGTEARLSGPLLYHALALPSVNALYPDASPRTLLNRNLRAFLNGYTAAGVPLRYFGTEVLSLLGHPVALVGYDQTAAGTVLLEVLVGLENPCVVRSAIARQPPASLWSILRQSPAPMDLLQRVTHGLVERLAAAATEIEAKLTPATRLAPRGLVSGEAVPAQVAIPLGVVEASLAPEMQLGGDLLVSRAALGEVEKLAAAAATQGPFDEQVLAPLAGRALDGARPADILSALRAAQAG